VKQREPSGDEAGRPESGLKASLSLLGRNRNFRNLYVASLASYAGDWFLTVALLGLVLQITHSALAASLVLVAQELPFFLVSPIAGALADRMDRQKIMVFADLARAATVLGLLFLNGSSRLWIAYAIPAVESALASFFEPASTAAVPNLVEAEDLSSANALAGSAWGTMLAVGAALGALVAATFGSNVAFICDSISFLVSAALLSRIHTAFSERRDEDEEHVGVVEATRETVRYARGDHRVVALLAVKGGFGLAGGVIVLLSVFGTKVFHDGDIGIGVLMSARGIGALTGPFIGKRIAGDSFPRLFVAIGLALVTFGFCYMLLPLSPSLLVAALFAAGAHLGGGAQWSLSTFGLQKIVPDHIRGRVFAFDVALITLTIAISSLAAGVAAQIWGPRIAMGVTAVLALGYAALWWWATRHVRAALR
jgi:predicted MFS family arabinose efflux permease